MGSSEDDDRVEVAEEDFPPKREEGKADDAVGKKEEAIEDRKVEAADSEPYEAASSEAAGDPSTNTGRSDPPPNPRNAEGNSGGEESEGDDEASSFDAVPGEPREKPFEERRDGDEASTADGVPGEPREKPFGEDEAKLKKNETPRKESSEGSEGMSVGASGAEAVGCAVKDDEESEDNDEASSSDAIPGEPRKKPFGEDTEKAKKGENDIITSARKDSSGGNEGGRMGASVASTSPDESKAGAEKGSLNVKDNPDGDESKDNDEASASGAGPREKGRKPCREDVAESKKNVPPRKESLGKGDSGRAAASVVSAAPDELKGGAEKDATNGTDKSKPSGTIASEGDAPKEKKEPKERKKRKRAKRKASSKTSSSGTSRRSKTSGDAPTTMQQAAAVSTSHVIAMTAAASAARNAATASVNMDDGGFVPDSSGPLVESVVEKLKPAEMKAILRSLAKGAPRALCDAATDVMTSGETSAPAQKPVEHPVKATIGQTPATMPTGTNTASAGTTSFGDASGTTFATQDDRRRFTKPQMPNVRPGTFSPQADNLAARQKKWADEVHQRMAGAVARGGGGRVASAPEQWSVATTLQNQMAAMAEAQKRSGSTRGRALAAANAAAAATARDAAFNGLRNFPGGMNPESFWQGTSQWPNFAPWHQGNTAASTALRAETPERVKEDASKRANSPEGGEDLSSQKRQRVRKHGRKNQQEKKEGAAGEEEEAETRSASAASALRSPHENTHMSASQMAQMQQQWMMMMRSMRSMMNHFGYPPQWPSPYGVPPHSHPWHDYPNPQPPPHHHATMRREPQPQPHFNRQQRSMQRPPPYSVPPHGYSHPWHNYPNPLPPPHHPAAMGREPRQQPPLTRQQRTVSPPAYAKASAPSSPVAKKEGLTPPLTAAEHAVAIAAEKVRKSDEVVKPQLDAAKALDFSLRPRPSRSGDGTFISVFSNSDPRVKRGPDDRLKYRVMLIVSEWDYNLRTHKEKIKLALGAIRLACYDDGYPSPKGTFAVDRWFKQFRESLLKGRPFNRKRKRANGDNDTEDDPVTEYSKHCKAFERNKRSNHKGGAKGHASESEEEKHYGEYDELKDEATEDTKKEHPENALAEYSKYCKDFEKKKARVKENAADKEEKRGNSNGEEAETKKGNKDHDNAEDGEKCTEEGLETAMILETARAAESAGKDGESAWIV